MADRPGGDGAGKKGSELLRTASPQVLAHLGDAVYELYVRTELVRAGVVHPRHLHRSTVNLVRAQAQAEALRRLEPYLTDEERDVVRRGRNAAGGARPGAASPAHRHASTALESLLGYLYLNGEYERLRRLLGLALPPEALRAEG